MKLAASLSIGIAIAIATFAYWNSTSNNHQLQLDNKSLVSRVTLLEGQLRDVSQFQQLLHDISGQTDKTPATNTRTARRQTQIDDRVKNQGHANDNQWQEIDFLKSQQVFQKRLIDQINFELDKLRRDQKAMGREFQQVPKVIASSNASDLADLTRRVDNLYRRIQR